MGKSFGFIQYKGVRDEENLVKEIRKVAVGPCYITGTVAKYKPTSPVITEAYRNHKEYHISPSLKSYEPAILWTKRSYADVLGMEANAAVQAKMLGPVRCVADEMCQSGCAFKAVG